MSAVDEREESDSESEEEEEEDIWIQEPAYVTRPTDNVFARKRRRPQPATPSASSTSSSSQATENKDEEEEEYRFWEPKSWEPRSKREQYWEERDDLVDESDVVGKLLSLDPSQVDTIRSVQRTRYHPLGPALVHPYGGLGGRMDLFVTGYLLHVMRSLALAPIERLKILMMCQREHNTLQLQPFKNSVAAARYIYKTQGFRSFWRGNLQNVFMFPPLRMSRWVGLLVTGQLYTKEDTTEMSLPAQIGVGGLTTFLFLALSYPFHHARTKLAMDMGHPDSRELYSAGHSLTIAFRSGGLFRRKGVFGGFGSAFYCMAGLKVVQALGSMAAMPLLLRGPSMQDLQYVSELSQEDQANLPQKYMTKLNDVYMQSMMQRFYIAYGFSVGAAAIVHPLEMVWRRKLMNNGAESRHAHPTRQVLSKLWRREGVRGLYRGWGANMVYSIGTAVMMVGVSALLEHQEVNLRSVSEQREHVYRSLGLYDAYSERDKRIADRKELLKQRELSRTAHELEAARQRLAELRAKQAKQAKLVQQAKQAQQGQSSSSPGPHPKQA